MMNGHISSEGEVVNGHSHMNGSVTKGEKQDVSNGKVVGFENVGEEDSTQYLNNYKAHRTGITHEEMVSVYTEWANHYDEVLKNLIIYSLFIVHP